MKKILIPLLPLLLLFSCKEMGGENDAIRINQQGIDFMNAGKYELALQAFFKAANSTRLSKDSKGTIYRNICLTYIDLQKKDSAIHFSALAAKCFKKNSFDNLVNLAEVDILTGKTASGLTRLLKAVKMNPDEMSVNNVLGLIYLGEYDATLTDLDKALTYNLKAYELNEGRGTEDVLARTYYKMNDYEKAESHYEHLLQKHADIISYSLNMGMTKYKMKKRGEAERLFEKVMTMDSTYAYAISSFKDANK
jgi:tetratricopeptide (TPR) repeat protein